MTLTVRTLTDPEERSAAIPALSDLRIRIFRGWPYLYDGTLDYEAEYLAEFMREPGSVLVVAQDGDAIVGAATASPMAGQKPEFQLPLQRQGLDVSGIFYFGESVIRGRASAIAFSTPAKLLPARQGRCRPPFAP
jgi:hypothetical protein